MKNQDSFQSHYDRIKPIIVLWVKRVYVIAFNFYAWFWLFRQIFIRQSTTFEPYLLWFFMTAGMYYFVLDNQDLFLKRSRNQK